MLGQPCRAERIATELGLTFTVELSHDKRWKRFKFDFDGIDKLQVENTVAWKGVPENLEVPKSLTDTIQRVTKWRNRIEPWLLIGTLDTVSAEQTLGSRLSVAFWNRKNRKRIETAQAQLAKNESYARRLATSQPTPMQAIKVLDSLTKLQEKETQEFRKQLVEAAQAFEKVQADALAHVEGRCGCPETPCPVSENVSAAKGAGPVVAAGPSESVAAAPLGDVLVGRA